MLYDYDFRLANPPFFPLPSLSSPVTMQFILGLLLAPTLVFFSPILPIFTTFTVMKILRIFSHPGTVISQDPFHAESEMCRTVSLPLPPLRADSGSPAGIWGVFLSQKAAGNRQITVICVSSLSGRAVCHFHLGNNRLLAAPPAQTQAAGEQQEQKSLAEV